MVVRLSVLHEDQYTLMISRWIFLRMRYVSEESCRENQNIHFTFSTLFTNVSKFLFIVTNLVSWTFLRRGGSNFATCHKHDRIRLHRFEYVSTRRPVPISPEHWHPVKLLRGFPNFRQMKVLQNTPPPHPSPSFPRRNQEYKKISRRNSIGKQCYM